MPEVAVGAVESIGWKALRSLAEEDGKPVASSRTAFSQCAARSTPAAPRRSHSDPDVVRWLPVATSCARLDGALVDAIALYPRTAARKLGSALRPACGPAVT